MKMPCFNPTSIKRSKPPTRPFILKINFILSSGNLSAFLCMFAFILLLFPSRLPWSLSLEPACAVNLISGLYLSLWTKTVYRLRGTVLWFNLKRPIKSFWHLGIIHRTSHSYWCDTEITQMNLPWRPYSVNKDKYYTMAWELKMVHSFSSLFV